LISRKRIFTFEENQLMKKNKIARLLNILLIITGIIMLILGIQSGILPPILTGIGFFLIAGIFYLKG